jgi:hypothetical protein
MLQWGPNIYFYNRNIKNMIIGFLNLFPQMQVKTFNTETGLPESTMTVPILFGPIERSSYINSKGETVQRTVQMPLLHFELTGMEKDKLRAFPMKTLHLIGARSGVQYDNLMPVPYNFTITMNIYAKYQEELMQLIEQIDPMFNYHRVYYTKHPIFPEEITLPHWVSITTPPSFAFNSEYSAEDRRGILAVPIGFTIESWLVREAYEAYGVIREIITNYRDYVTQAGLSQIRLVGDPTIREVIYTSSKLYTPAIGQLLTGAHYSATIVDTPSGFSGFSSYYTSGASSGWSGYSDGKLIVKFNTENEVFLKNEAIRVGASSVGTTCTCEPYEPFLEADTGWSSYSGVSAVSGWSMYSGLSGYSTYIIYPPYSGYSDIKTDGLSGVL